MKEMNHINDWNNTIDNESNIYHIITKENIYSDNNEQQQ